MSDWKCYSTFIIRLPCDAGVYVELRATRKTWEAIYGALGEEGEGFEVLINNMDCKTVDTIKRTLRQFGIEEG